MARRLPVGAADRQERSSSTVKKVDPLDTGSIAAAGDKKIGDPQKIKKNTLTRKRDGTVGLSIRAIGGQVSGERTDTSTRFSTNGRDPGKPQGHNPNLKTDPSAETFGGALDPNKLGYGEGRTFTTRTDVSKGGNIGPVGVSVGDGKSREMSVYRPRIETDSKSGLVRKGGAHERLRVTTRESDRDKKGVADKKTGVGADVKASRGTAYTYDVDPKNKKAVAALKEYERTGLMPGVRELLNKGTPEERKRVKQLLGQFDAAHGRIAELKKSSLTNHVDPRRPGMFPFVGAGIKRGVESQMASAELTAARKSLNERWKKAYALSRKPGEKGRGDIMPGLKLVREDKVRTLDGRRAGNSYVRERSGRVRTDSF